MSIAVEISTHPYAICHHSCCLMSLFQGHAACPNFTPTEPQQKFIEMFLIKADYFYFKSNKNRGMNFNM